MNDQPEYLRITVSAHALQLLATANDRSVTPEQRADARTELCGYLSAIVERDMSDPDNR